MFPVSLFYKSGFSLLIFFQVFWSYTGIEDAMDLVHYPSYRHYDDSPRYTFL